jgi:hypothetical protein
MTKHEAVGLERRGQMDRNQSRVASRSSSRQDSVIVWLDDLPDDLEEISRRKSE